MKATHTPGPWEVRLPDETHLMAIKTDTRIVAMIANHPRPDINEQGLPNAKLIAAAPEMFETLQHTKILLEHIHDELDQSDVYKDICKLIERIEA